MGFYFQITKKWDTVLIAGIPNSVCELLVLDMAVIGDAAQAKKMPFLSVRKIQMDLYDFIA